MSSDQSSETKQKSEKQLTKLEKQQKRQEYLNSLYDEARTSRKQFAEELSLMPKMKPTKLILLVGWSLCMAAMDNSIVNIANPSIQKESNFVPENTSILQSEIQWINDLYSMAFAAMAIPASKIGDRYGVTIVHRWGVFGFMVCSLMCGVSKYISYEITPWKYGGFYVLIVFRLLQGIFAGFLMSNTMSLCSICVERQDIPKSMAMNSLGFAAATALGPPLGGLLTTFVGWQWCFFINLFIGTGSIIVCWLYIPKVPKFKEPKIDILGFFLVLISLLFIILGLSFIPPERHAWGWGVISLVGGILVLVGFVFWELHHPFAILPASILKNKKIICSLIAGMLNFSLVVTITFQQPFVLQNIYRMTALEVGLVTLVNPVCQILAAFVANKIYRKITSYMLKFIISLLSAGLLIGIGGVVFTEWYYIILLTYTASFVISIFFVNNNSFIMQLATPDIRGMLGGCLQAFRETGYAVGIALVSLIHDLYINIEYGEDIMPDYDDPDYPIYRDVYFWAYFYSTVAMGAVSILGMGFAMMSGVGDWEKDQACYPKWLKKEGNNIETGDETESIVKNAEPVGDSVKKE